MNIIAELHCHTSVSGHAFNSLTEMAKKAAGLGYYAFAVTNHVGICDTISQLHFGSYKYLPRRIEEIFLISGVEADIIDFEGTVDMSGKVLAGLDFRIASIHEPEAVGVAKVRKGNVEENTAAYLGVMKNPEIDCIGHMGNMGNPCNFEEVVRAAAAAGKVIELNSSYPKRTRENAEGTLEIMKLCKKYDVRTAVTTDSHSIYTMEDMKIGTQILESIGFPEELVINSSADRLTAYFEERKGRNIFEDLLCL